MAFDRKQIDYRVCEVVNGGFKVYSDQYHYGTVYCNDVVSADWSGDAIIAKFSNGELRRYTDLYHYNTIHY